MSLILAAETTVVNFPPLLGAALETLGSLADALADAGRLAECHAVEDAWSLVAADDAEYDAWLAARTDDLATEAAYDQACEVGYLVA